MGLNYVYVLAYFFLYPTHSRQSAHVYCFKGILVRNALSITKVHQSIYCLKVFPMRNTLRIAIVPSQQLERFFWFSFCKKLAYCFQTEPLLTVMDRGPSNCANLEERSIRLE